jgi:hypothetical protein
VSARALLDVRPLVAQADGAVEEQGLARVVGEVAEPLELDDLAGRGVGERGSTLQPVSTWRESGSTSSSGSPDSAPGTSAVKSRSYRCHGRVGTAWAADTQCIVAFTLRPSGAWPPAVSGS